MGPGIYGGIVKRDENGEVSSRMIVMEMTEMSEMIVTEMLEMEMNYMVKAIRMVKNENILIMSPGGDREAVPEPQQQAWTCLRWWRLHPH